MALSYIFKSSVKLGIVGGSIYYTIDRGYWGEAEQAIEAHEQLKNKLQKIPIKIQYIEIPYLDKIPFDRLKGKEDAMDYWNWGVKSFFFGLNCLPGITSKYTKIGWDKLVEVVKQ
ncbi:hypothetical protein CHUAL_010439 [Chamberlinius hualienensis]